MQAGALSGALVDVHALPFQVVNNRSENSSRPPRVKEAIFHASSPRRGGVRPSEGLWDFYSVTTRGVRWGFCKWSVAEGLCKQMLS